MKGTRNNRDRRVAALDDLQPLLDEQATALGDLWGFLMNPAVRPYVTISPEDAWKVLKAKKLSQEVMAYEPSSVQSNK